MPGDNYTRRLADMTTVNQNRISRVTMIVLNDVIHDSRVRREADALAGAGYDVTIIGTQRICDRLPDTESFAGWTLIRYCYGSGLERLRRYRALAPLRHLWQAAGLIRFLRRQMPAIWHAHDFPALLLVTAARLGKRRPGKLVYDSHELYFQREDVSRRGRGRCWRRIGATLERRLARRADLLLTTSPGFAAFLSHAWSVPPPVVVLNGAILPDDTPPLERPPGARLWLVHTGYLLERGRLLEQILSGLTRTAPDVHLTFLGEGPSEARLRSLSNELVLSERVHFVPLTPPEKVSAAIRGADAAVIAFDPRPPGYALTLPNKLFEAIAAGCPVLAHRTPGLEAFLKEYPVGVLWDSSDPASFPAALSQLAADSSRARWQSILQATQQIVGWDAQAARLADAYSRIAPEE